MSAGSILFVAFVAIAALALLWLFARWLTGAWEVLDDDQLHDKLGGERAPPSPLFWLRLTGRLRQHRQLTYRRDKRGRFRRFRR